MIIKLKVTDSSGLYTNTERVVRLIGHNQIVILSKDKDRDNDGLNDFEEGRINSDDDGIPDYQDNSNIPYLLPTSKTIVIASEGSTVYRSVSMKTKPGQKNSLRKNSNSR